MAEGGDDISTLKVVGLQGKETILSDASGTATELCDPTPRLLEGRYFKEMSSTSGPIWKLGQSAENMASIRSTFKFGKVFVQLSQWNPSFGENNSPKLDYGNKRTGFASLTIENCKAIAALVPKLEESAKLLCQLDSQRIAEGGKPGPTTFPSRGGTGSGGGWGSGK